MHLSCLRFPRLSVSVQQHCTHKSLAARQRTLDTGKQRYRPDMIYRELAYLRVKSESSDDPMAKPDEIKRRCSLRWKALTDTEKQLFSQSPISIRETQRGENHRSPTLPATRYCNAYMLFCHENSRGIRRKHPDLSNTAIVQKLAESWSKLDPKMSARYKLKAENALKTCHKGPNLTFPNNLTSPQTVEKPRWKTKVTRLKRLNLDLSHEITIKGKKRTDYSKAGLNRLRILHGMPKAPPTPFIRYRQSLVVATSEQFQSSGRLPSEKISQFAAEKWKVLAEDKKRALHADFESAMSKYRDEIEKWKNQMKAEQKGELIKILLH